MKERNGRQSNGSCDVGNHGNQHLSGGTAMAVTGKDHWQKMEHIRRLHIVTRTEG